MQLLRTAASLRYRPDRFPVDFPHRLPFHLYRDNTGAIKHTFNFSQFESGAEVTLYCDSVGGSDTGGGTPGSPYRTLKKCFTTIAADATHTFFLVKVRNSVTRNQVHDETLGATPMSLAGKKISIMPEGANRLYMGNVQTSGTESGTSGVLSWTADGTAYKCTRSTTMAAFDITNRDTYGRARPLDWAADSAACQATANTWYTDGTTVWVHTFDGRAADNKILIGINVGASLNVDISDGILYLKNFEFFNGLASLAALNITGNINSQCYINDCITVGGYGKNVAYTAEPTANALGIVNVGKTFIFNSKTGYVRRDGFNYHFAGIDAANRNKCLVFEYDCYGSNVGRYPVEPNQASKNNNVSTCHESASIIRVGCSGNNAYGPVCVDIDGCYSICIDCDYSNSDVVNSNSASCIYQFQNTDGSGKAMLINCKASGNAMYDLSTTTGFNVHVKNFNGTRISANNLTRL